MNRIAFIAAVIFGALGILAIVTGVFLTSDFHKEVTYPAYLSYLAECAPNGAELVAERGYVISGETTVTYNPINNTVVNVSYVDYGLSPTTTSHELCHVRQAHEGRFVPCSKPLRYYFNEVECYDTTRG